jgi:hypothetical protein
MKDVDVEDDYLGVDEGVKEDIRDENILKSICYPFEKIRRKERTNDGHKTSESYSFVWWKEYH